MVHFFPSLPPHSAPANTEIIWSRSTNSPSHLFLNTGDFCCGNTISQTISIISFPSKQERAKVMVCNKQMSPNFWAQQHCRVPALGFSHKYFLSKVHFKTQCSARLHGAQTKRMLHLLPWADYSCRNFKRQLWVYSKEFLCRLKPELTAQALQQMALLLHHITQAAPSHQVRSPCLQHWVSSEVLVAFLVMVFVE